MQIFYQKIFNGFLAGTANVYTDTATSLLLGSVDHLTFFANVLGVSGTSPTITCQLEQSDDGVRWQNQSGTAELNAWSLSAGDNLAIPFISTPGGPILKLVRLRIALGGTSPAAVVRVLANGSSYSDP